MYIKTHVARHERGLWTRRGDLVRVLRPGTHWNPAWLVSAVWLGDHERVETFDTTAGRFQHKHLETLVREPDLRTELLVVELADEQRALVWRDGRLFDVLGPGLAAYWREAGAWRVETFDVGEVRLEHPKLQAVLSHPKAATFLSGVVVDQEESALVYRDGRFVELVGPGLHVYWKGAGRITWRSVDRREKTLDVAGQEIMTLDKVSLRVNLTVAYAVADAVKSAQASADAPQALYREAQLALRAAVGTRTLDALLAEKDAVADAVRDVVAAKADALGLRVTSAGLRDVILPGDMRELFNAVIAAQKQAEANLIQRREETAAARSQANTARLLAENPVLARMRELELMKDVLAGAKVTFVLGDRGLTEQLRGLVAGAD